MHLDERGEREEGEGESVAGMVAQLQSVLNSEFWPLHFKSSSPLTLRGVQQGFAVQIRGIRGENPGPLPVCASAQYSQPLGSRGDRLAGGAGGVVRCRVG